MLVIENINLQVRTCCKTRRTHTVMPIILSRNKIIPTSRSIKTNHQFNYKVSLEIYWPHFKACKLAFRNSLEVASANYMIYGVLYGGREVRQLSSTCHQSKWKLWCHFPSFFFFLIPSLPQPSIKKTVRRIPIDWNLNRPMTKKYKYSACKNVWDTKEECFGFCIGSNFLNRV